MSTWSKLAGMRLTVEAVELEPRSLNVGTFHRHTTIVRLSGGGYDGCGEDVTYDGEEQRRFRNARIAWPCGAFDLAGFSAALDEVQLFERPPQQAMYLDYRRWAVEAAALDLALRQANATLARQLGLAAQPVRFVASMGLGQPPSTDRLRELMACVPGTRFKLDWNPGWSRPLLDELEGMHVVDVVDFKGAYTGTPVDTVPDATLYRGVAEALPAVILEDPKWSDEAAAELEPFRDRISWDAPIHSTGDMEALPFAPRVMNIKPSRFGTLERLFDAYDYCNRHGIAMYGGGQFELDVGRLQIQTLASLFHGDAPNDTSPVAYHDAGNHEVLPGGPLDTAFGVSGFTERPS
ncbi:MAG: hypothetical protein GTN89_05620 [Acidobacteria bacterium]|nr:hypothetical protein [Acidobacteriota bacterium]NIM61367.1 hypothetical protein [Acidobacteriota bacterium]NIO58802.1 hypothetical protein [Acidobacteriota bacterium]NIQ29846.1 hypothetical protein [Acidobacteriota bacterium]NIQ84579.1 hypothetical protein [Acidobacteriota bacterium]